MRSGQNPMKWLAHDEDPERVTVTMITHIPVVEGYWAESLRVLELCLASLGASTEVPFDLMVLDNGSAPEVRTRLAALQADGTIQFLILSSRNLRKLGGLDLLLAAAPGEIVSYADSDVLFLPGWLEASLELLETFPEAGQVTALATADTASRHTERTLAGIRRAEEAGSVTVERGGALLPERWIEAHRTSLGATREDYAGRLAGREDVRIERGGAAAWASAQDFQFTTTRAVLDRVLPLVLTDPDEYYDPVYSPVLEARIDREGLWRLAIDGYRIHHLGNTLPRAEDLPSWLDLVPLGPLPFAGRDTPATASRRPAAGGGRVANRHLRRLLKRINTWSYRLLYGG